MSELLTQILAGFQAMSYWEYLAVFLSVAYLLLAMFESLWCWPAAFISTFIYTLLFFNGALLMDSALNVFYMAMAFYGWYSWRNHSDDVKTQHELPIQSWSLSLHGRIISVTFVVSMVIGYIMDNYTHADFAYLDSLTSCFSVVSTYLVTKKVLENWLYWLVIDVVAVYLYVEKGFYPTTILFVFYTLMSAWGYLQWRQSLTIDQRQSATA
jgi:nicotinamide mononucleotide transporter